MRILYVTTALAAGLAMAACSYNKDDYNEANASYNSEGVDYNGTAGGGYNTAMASNWPEGARIVEEDGIYYRIDTGGARVRLEPGDSTIVVDNGVRYRVDPGGTRVRINDQGAVIEVAPVGVDATVNTGDANVSMNTH